MQDVRPTLAQHVCGWSPAQLPDIAARLSADQSRPAKAFGAYDSYAAYFEPLLLAELATELAAAAEAAATSIPSPASASGKAPPKASSAPAAPRRVTISRAVIDGSSDGAIVDVDPVGPPADSLGLYDGAVVALWESDRPREQPPSSRRSNIPSTAVMAVVRHPLSRRGGARLYLTSWPGAKSAVNPADLEDGEEPEDAVEDSRHWTLLPLSSMVTMRREHEALLNIKNAPLLASILSPSTPAASAGSSAAAPDTATAEALQQTLSYAGKITSTSGLNQSQTCAVTAAATSLRGFTVVQGPPGTGKTRTILAMLNVLHVDQYQRYYNGLLESLEPQTGKQSEPSAVDADVSAPQPRLVGGRRRSATFLGGMVGAMDRTLAQKFDGLPTSGGGRARGAASGARPKRPRLLVCAPSNAAVDEILTRLITNKFVDGGGSPYSPEIARVGGGDKVSAAARPLTAEGQAETFLDQFAAPDGGTRGRRGREATEVDAKARQRAYLSNWQNMCNSLLAQLERTPKDLASRPRVVALHEQLERLYRDLRRLRIAAGGSVESPMSREVRLRKLARTYVEDAQIVFATLSGSASAILTQPSDAGDPSGALFDTVIMDEGSQATEPSCLIPLTLGATRCLLVGDPQQLPATVLSSGSAGVAYGQSLLDRLCRCGTVVLLLDTQYRMHPAISSFPRRYFYDGRLKDDVSVQDEHRAKPCHLDVLRPRLGPYAFLDVAEGQERRGGPGAEGSIFNPHEAELAVALYRKLKKDYPADIVFSDRGKMPGSTFGFGVVTPYKRQLRELRQAFDRAGVPTGDVEVDTVDSYQGREKDVVIFSCVRTAQRSGIGFVRDVRRMNVGLTRARSSLIVLGSAKALCDGSHDWSELIDDAESRGCLVRIGSVSRGLVLEADDGATVTGRARKRTTAGSGAMRSSAVPAAATAGAAKSSPPARPVDGSSRGLRGRGDRGGKKRARAQAASVQNPLTVTPAAAGGRDPRSLRHPARAGEPPARDGASGGNASRRFMEENGVGGSPARAG
jgi:superfamily I DNA and/or RNA helicase